MPAGVWVLGFTSLFMDVSSEMIQSLLPVFLVASLGASATVVGLIEGLAESAALIVRIFSGTLSDYWGRRKPLTVLGYGMSAACKPLFAVAGSVPWVLFARFSDRIGKGIRAAPRDALIADLTPPELRGRAYGLRQTLDSVGAFIGPLVGLALMAAYPGDFRRVFWFAALPATMSVLLLSFWLKEPERPRAARELRSPIDRRALSRLGPAFWSVTALGAAFMGARLGEAFLILRARELGLPDGQAPLMMVLMNTVYALAGYPCGVLADRLDRRTLMTAAALLLAAAHGCLASATGLGAVIWGVALFGLQMALSQGLLSAMVADSAEPELRGTAFGVYNCAAGVALLAAAVGTGALWDRFGSPAAFSAGLGLSLACAAGLAWVRPPARA